MLTWSVLSFTGKIRIRWKKKPAKNSPRLRLNATSIFLAGKNRVFCPAGTPDWYTGLRSGYLPPTHRITCNSLLLCPWLFNYSDRFPFLSNVDVFKKKSARCLNPKLVIGPSSTCFSALSHIGSGCYPFFQALYFSVAHWKSYLFENTWRQVCSCR